MEDFHGEQDLSSDSVEGAMQSNIRGQPNQDYPVLTSIPETSFKCSEQEYPGYYADVEARCQVFHICQKDGRSDAFLCPNGTIFSQQHFVCVWWYDYDCSTSSQYFALNSELYQEKQNSEMETNSFEDSSFGGNNLDKYSYSNGNAVDKSRLAKLNNYAEVANTLSTTRPDYSGRLSAQSVKGRTMAAVQYSAPNTTPSPVKSAPTTPDSLDEALGQEIHTSTPLIESLPLTTLEPLGLIDSFYGASTNKPSIANYYNQLTSPAKSDSLR